MGRVIITARTRSLLHELDAETAMGAGFETLEELYAYWRDRYRTGPGTAGVVVEVPVFVLRFVPYRVEPTLYLRPGGGYTSTPSQAIQDSLGMAEWAPPRAWLEQSAREVSRRDHEDRIERAMERKRERKRRRRRAA